MTTRKAKATTDVPPRKRAKREAASEEESSENEIDLSQNPGFINTEDIDESPEPGIIEMVRVKNFLCHEHQELKFGPRVNFLIGNNGSGKSAIMTAVIVGLGGKATSTSRGSSVKNFVKHGHKSAKIEIQIRNQGQDAFKRNEYGDSITVERRLDVNGVHGPYLLKNVQGQVVSQKKEDLNHMLDQLNIQVDNPVSLLTQDTCKTFLHSKSGQDKYAFFMRATQLEQMKQDYRRANNHKERTKNILSLKLQELPALDKEVREWEEKTKAFEAIEQLRTKVDTLKDELAWSIVTEKERSVEPLRKELKIQEARTPKFVAKVEEMEQKVQNCITKRKAIEDHMTQLSQGVEDLMPKHNELKAAKDGKKKTFRQKQAEVQSLQKDFKRFESDRAATKERISEIQTRMVADFESKKRERQNRIASLQAELDRLSAQMKTTEHLMGQFKAAVMKGKQEISKLRNDERDLTAQKDQFAKEIRDLQGTKNNKLRRFGKDMPELVKQIDEAFRKGVFHQKPRGPIGALIDVTRPEWAIAIEVCLAEVLTAFCVTDHHDERELEKIMKRTCTSRKPTIITTRFIDRIHDVKKNKPRTQYSTVFDMIDIKKADPVVINCLIDQKMIEGVILIPTTSEINAYSQTNPPKTVRMAYTMEGDQAFFTPTFRYYSLPQEKTSSVLTSNLEDSINSIKQKLAQAEQRLSNKKQEIRTSEAEISANQKEERSHHHSFFRVNEQCATIKFEIQELKSTEDESAPDVTTLEEDVARYEENMAAIEQQIEEQNSRLEQIKVEYDKAEQAFKDLDTKVRQMTGEIDPKQEEHDKLADELEIAKRHRKHYVDKRKEHDAKVKELTAKLKVMDKDVQESVAKAEAICERKKTRRTPQNIESEIIQIEKRINAEEKTRGNRDEIMRRYTDTYDKLQKIKRDVHNNKTFLERLEEVMCLREQNFFHFRKIIALRAKYCFITSLNLREYNGKLSFDHNNESLTLNVQPNVQQSQASKDMRSLSGGERSFSTVCFILALWDAIESPFRMLDEFDVYMDMVNRRVAMKMLVEATAAKNSGNRRRQFVFLTPQDMSYMPGGDVRILRMIPPLRDGQRRMEDYAASSTSHAHDDEEDAQ